ncbi:GNAT family N-acetyltransferase [Accumulibacter sp.]|uniref:GNAT family N-acetyltransferase n=1 Tax=Accumulibacter sp. TaxID=2053492 RepID=UPI0025DE79D7|nr:GNAT family N-acetyltransferase [Accumulibacter sp.]MCM8594606.1 GNAT family N-acetyltransferase [Accumulibacter sp.]MCM8627243.1 GNAT family N-acetyltransferase [Accumulibacter sp.]MDS4048752.1 GNAT family N-acetyltransferase [Accumulibacter sp.]
MDASRYRATETLRDGRAVVVRAIRPDDKQAMLDAYHGLDEKTVYLRFFSAHGEPTAKELREWTEVDFASIVRLIVCLPRGEGERIIGGASYALLDRGNQASEAEISFTIEEDFQGQGLASKLLGHLTRIAQAAGIRRFVAETLLENRAMLAVFAHSALPMSRRFVNGVVHVTLDLPE